MGFFERKWVLALLVLAVIVGFNGISGWVKAQGETVLEASESADGTTEASPQGTVETTPSEAPQEASMMTVHICGAVAVPGVFQVPEGSRVNDVLEMAGGFTPKADTISANLAELVTDGQQIVIYEKDASSASPLKSPGVKPAAQPSPEAALPVSINKGSLEALMLLDGIGEKTAQKIIDYRKAQGGFKTIEELKNVPGIGDKKFDAIKNDVKL